MKKLTNQKLTNQKLKLNRQTIAVLSTLQLSEIAGGGGRPENVSEYRSNCCV